MARPSNSTTPPLTTPLGCFLYGTLHRKPADPLKRNHLKAVAHLLRELALRMLPDTQGPE